MYDINFYMKSHELKKRIESGENIPMEEAIELFESYRSKEPIIYNIETTNACNMRCRMCPRTTKMTRAITFLQEEYYERLITQIKPHDSELWARWEQFCTETYGIAPDDQASENHFFLYIIPKVIQLHGYGDPLLDKNLGKAIETLTKHGFGSYFSCNPANINVERTVEMMESGLTYLKYSFESTDDLKFKDIRGNAANFTEAFEKTVEVLKIRERKGLDTQIIITMIDVGHDEAQQYEFRRLTEVFKDLNVYIYLKSEDQQWYRKDDSLKEYLEHRDRDVPEQEKDFYGTNAIHWLEYCKHPWMSMTIKSDGEVHMCMEDYNNEIFLGNSNEKTLYDIWNGELYAKFRRDHFELNPCIKCNQECDMPKVGEYFAS
jgi:radical SAM protein with 4Fe4S-binding SPASM domain